MIVIPEELRELQSVVRRWVDDEVIPLERRVDGDMVPDDVMSQILARAREIGIWALGVPQTYGGSGVGALGPVLVLEELTRSYLTPHFTELGHPLSAMYAASPEQTERYLAPTIRGDRLGAFALTEPTGGADPAGNMQTAAAPNGDKWVINGRKCFVTNGAKADYYIVFALTDAALRQRGGITAFIVDREAPGVDIVREIPTMGSFRPAEIAFDECVVSDMNRLGGVGQGFAFTQHVLGQMRMEIGARAVGVCARLIDLGVEYVKSRSSFGIPVAERQSAQWALADSAIELDACRWMTYAAAARADAGEDVRFQNSAVKVFASETMCRVVDRILQLFGGWGYSKDFPVERFYRDLRVWRIVEGPNEVHRWVVARQLLGAGTEALRPY